MQRGVRKIPTGIPGFDHISEGGLPEGGLTLLSGTAGSTKTTFAIQFLVEGIRQFGSPAVFVTFEERPDRICQHMLSLGWDIETWQEEGKWAFVDASPYTDGQQIQSGEFDLDALLVRIEYAVTSIGAKRIVLDSLGTMFSQVSDTQHLRRELFRIAHALQNKGLTGILTAERDNETRGIVRYGIEEFVAENVVVLRNLKELDKRRRTIEILKFRGATHQKGEFPFTVLDGKGIIVIPLSSIALKQKASDERTTSGNPHLDDMCGGGLLRASIILISGATGTGKTLTATQFIGAGAMIKERCLIFAFEESRDQLFRNASAWGYDFEASEREGFIEVMTDYPEVTSLDEHFIRIKEAVHRYKPQRVAIDSLSALERVSSEKSFREFVITMTSFFKDQEIMTLCTSTTPALLGGSSITEAHISTITDTIILLRYVELMGEMRRGIMVLKMRGSKHNKEIREFIIDDSGMHIQKPFQNVTGILSGNASVVVSGSEMGRMKSLFENDSSHLG
jgi:circadian clock protein KaiC